MEHFKWEKDANGAIRFFPYVGHQTATMSDKIGLLRLEFVSSPDQRDQDAHALQLALSRDQARELGKGLLLLADAPHIPHPPTGSRH